MLLKPRVPATVVTGGMPPPANVAKPATESVAPVAPAPAARPPAASSAPVIAARPAPMPMIPPSPQHPTTPSSGVLIARPADLPAYIDVVTPGEFSGIADNVKADGLQLPLLYLMQPMTKSVVEGRLKGGDVVLSSDVETKLFGLGDEVCFVPFFAFREWIEWRHRDLGGGLLARDKNSQGELAKQYQRQWRERPVGGGKPTAEQQPARVEEYIVILALFEGALDEPVAFPLGKSKYRQGSGLLKLAKKRVGVPLYGTKFSVKTVLEQSKKGDPFFNFNFAMAGNPTSEEYWKAKIAASAAKEGFDAIVLAMEEKDDEPAHEAETATGGAGPGY